MTLESLRKKALYQNSMDTWITYCEEHNIEWFEKENYRKFIDYLNKNNLNMKKFPLCVNESDGVDEKAKARVKFAEILSESEEPNSAVYTIKLSDATIDLIRKFCN